MAGTHYLQVKMPNGQIQLFSNDTPELHTALASGGQPYDESGNLMPSQQVAGTFNVGGQPLSGFFSNGALPAGGAKTNAASATGGQTATNSNATNIAQQSAGLQANPNNYTIQDALRAALGNRMSGGLQGGAQPPSADQAAGYVEGGNTTPAAPPSLPVLSGSPINNSNGQATRAAQIANTTQTGFGGTPGTLPDNGGASGTQSTGTFANPENPFAALGLGDNPMSPQVNLGTMPLMSGEFSPEFQQQYRGNLGAQVGNVGGFWQAPEAAQAAQMNLGQIPQAQQTPQNSFAALQFLLSGQGFDPATLAKMHANATDQVANQGSAALSASRLAAERAGFGNSGMNVALQEQQARDNAANQTTANNQIDIQNAQQGMQNLTAGAGMESGRQANNAQQANLMALQNASNLIQAMNTNVQNLQQSNMTNYAGNLSTNQGRAQAQSNAETQGGNAYNTAALNQSQQANSGNAAAGQNWGLNQAQLTQGNNQFNVAQTNANTNNAMGNLVSLTNGAGGVPAASAAGSLSPYLNFNNPYAGVLSSAAQGAVKVGG